MRRCGRKSLANSFFSFPAAADVRRGGSGIRANAGHMDQAPDARFSKRKPGDLCCGLDSETEWKVCGPLSAYRLTAFHDALDTRDGSGDGAIVIDVGLDRVEVKGGEKRRNAFRMPHRYPHARNHAQADAGRRWPKASPPKTVTFRETAIVLFLAMPS